ncbi:MAG: hypothetical protein U0324_25165 [Polyangiales bacterium]
MIPIIRLFNPKGPDRVAVVSVQAAWAKPGQYNVQVARGPRRSKLAVGVAFGPFAEHELPQRHAAVLHDLRQEGFVRAGLTALTQALMAGDPKKRAHAATRLGWLGDTTAVPQLILTAEQQGTDLPSIVDALGRLGDPRALPLCRAEAARKLLSRRRAGVEALRNLGDKEGLAEAVQRAVERLPPAVAVALAAAKPDDVSDAAVQSVAAAWKGVDAKELGLCFDSLYEIGTALSVAAARHGLANVSIAAPHIWRYAKSVFKRSLLRGDAETFGWLQAKVDRVGRKSHGTTAIVKSGLDGVQRSTKIFQKPTQDFVRRFAWRQLVQYARHRPAKYPWMAAHALAAYTPEDRQPDKGAYDAWARAFVFHRVLRGESQRFQFMARTLSFRVKAQSKKHGAPPEGRVESYPDLWDAAPGAYLVLLTRSKLVEVIDFAVNGVKRHPEALHAATHAEVLAMLGAPHDDAVALASAELERRFDPALPDWSLVEALLGDGRPTVRALGQRFLASTAPLWTADVERVVHFLGSADAGTRTVAAGLVVASLDDADVWHRRELAERLLAILQAGEPTAGAHEGYARVARDGLAKEFSDLLGIDELMAMVTKGSPAAQAVGGTVLGHKPEALAALGLPRVLAMAIHDVAAVREAAQGMLGSALDELKKDPSVLFTLAESEWADTREFAFDTLRTKVDLAALGLDGYVGLCDSNRPEVQAFGREVVLRDIASLDMGELIHRLSQHPAPAMRRFALDLVVGHLKPGFVALARLENFFRACLFDLWPSRVEKRNVVDFLLARGLVDERQAEVASRVLGDFVRTKGRQDFERALDALVRLRMAHPEVESRVNVVGVSP